jgi:HK97 family phage prohead protease
VIEHKTLSLAVKAADDAAGWIEVYGAAFGNVDRQGEVISPGAFKNLDEFAKDGWLAINHDWKALPVASVAAVSQDEVGLLVRAHWHTTPDAQAARTVVRERKERGKGVKASIGYEVMADRFEDRDGKRVRILDGLKLHEVSIVNLPANPLAEVMAAKSWADDYEQAFVDLKEGRAISARRRERLARLMAELGELLAETEPVPKARDDAAPAADEADPAVGDAGKAARLDAGRREVARYLALCAFPHLSRVTH